jgi:hypothetical protein
MREYYVEAAKHSDDEYDHYNYDYEVYVALPEVSEVPMYPNDRRYQGDSDSTKEPLFVRDDPTDCFLYHSLLQITY